MQQHEEFTVQPVTAFGGGSVMVWAGISLMNKTAIVRIEGNLIGNRYLNDILRPHVLPFAAAHGDGFVFMVDNARPHRAREVNAFLEE